MRLVAAIELGLALVFLGRGFTRIYFRRAVARFGVDGVGLAQTLENGLIPAWVSLVLVGGWIVAASATVWLFLT